MNETDCLRLWGVAILLRGTDWWNGCDAPSLPSKMRGKTSGKAS